MDHHAHPASSALRCQLAAASLLFACTATVTAQPAEPVFVNNAGQWPAELAGRATVGGGTAWFLADRVALQLRRVADQQPANAGTVGGPAPVVQEAHVTMRFSGTSAHRRPIMQGESAAPVRWICRGADGTPTTIEAGSYPSLRYSELWPGIDAVFRGVDGHVAYEFEVAPDRAADAIEITCDGLAAPLSIAADGSLVMVTEHGAIRQTAPRSFELLTDGTRIPVRSAFELRDTQRYGITVERIDASRALWIDPGIEWMTMFGSAGTDGLLYTNHAVAGVFVTAGWTDSSLPAPWSTVAPVGLGGLPVSAFHVDGGAGSLMWTTLIDGSGSDLVYDMAYDEVSTLTSVVGITNSADLPVTANALQPTLAGGYDGFLAQFDLGGNLVYLSYLGGAGEDRLVDVHAHGGIVTAVGATASATLPITFMSWQPRPAGGIDGYVVRLDPAQPVASQVVAATYFGSRFHEGLGYDPNSYWKNYDMKHVHVASNGEVTIVTNTASSAAPMQTTAGAYATTTSGDWDTWIGRFDARLSKLTAATLLGGSSYDLPLVAAVDATGAVTLGLATQSADLPLTPGAFDTSYAGSNDCFLARIDLGRTGNSQLAYGSFFGGADGDEAYDVVLEPSSSIATFVGVTQNAGFGIAATPGAYQLTPTSGTPTRHGFALRVEMAGNGLADVHYATYVSPATETEVLNVASDDYGRHFLVGSTYASTFSASRTGPQAMTGGGVEGFALLMDLLPAGVHRIGTASPACANPAHMQVDSQPIAGNAGFSLLCENAPATATGTFLIGTPLPAGINVLGIDAYVAPIIALPVASDVRGFAAVDLPIPVGMNPSFGLAAQFAWVASSPCAGSPLSASDALSF